MKRIATFALLTALVVGCNTAQQGDNTGGTDKGVSSSATLPVFKHAPSEYPSWSTYMVAAKYGLLNPKEGGEHGSLEKKYGVDCVLKVADYDTCITLYANGEVDSVCICNMDVLNPSLGRPATAIIPTSTSDGADMILGVGINDIDELKTVGITDQKEIERRSIYLLTKSVSHVTVYRCLEKAGKNPKDFTIAHLDPGAAATALQSGSPTIRAICVWNPFALTVLKKNKDAKVLASSAAIPGEIIDMAAVGNDSLKKTGGKEYATFLCAVYYEVSKLLADPKTEREATVALGEDFSDLPYDDMKTCLQQTKFYGTPQAGIDLFTSATFKKNMDTMVATCKAIEILEGDADKRVKLGYDDPNGTINFSTEYIKAVK